MKSNKKQIMDTADLYKSIISVIQKSFIKPAERFGLSVTELKGLDPSIEDLILHFSFFYFLLCIIYNFVSN
jgi:hypothetical protein